MNMTVMIEDSVDDIFHEIVHHYRYLHQHPELSYNEKNTSQYICQFLEFEDIPFRNGIGGTGILAWIKGEKEEGVIQSSVPVVGFVADMDALPVSEENNISFKSENEGIMHACGHDAQSASLMGAAKILNKFRNEFTGTALLIFQPGEEKSPGGAYLMLEDGVFNDFRPDYIVKQHAYVDLPTGNVGFQSGTIMASADEIHITVKGQGGHGALPHELNDTVLAASNIVIAMQQIVSRRKNPFSPMSLSFGKFIANGATNVIPSEVYLAGSLRCMNETERQNMLHIIPDIIKSTANAYGCTCDVNIPDGYPSTYSDAEITSKMREMAISFLGDERVTDFPKRMTADDFGFFTQQYPCCYFRFGVSGVNNDCGKLHSSTFLIDEEALKTSVGLFTCLAFNSLK